MIFRNQGVWMVALLVSGACQIRDEVPNVARETSSLIGGAVDQGEYPSAVALSRQTGTFCTGTLVSPSVVLTAAHCIDMFGNDPSVVIFFGSDVNGEGTRIGVSKSHAHPSWTGDLEGNHDIGLLLMNFPANPDAAVALKRKPVEVGDQVIRVGFGIYDAATEAQDGKKRTGTTTINYVADTQDWFLAGDAELITCNGDSGGPAYEGDDEGNLKVVGVHSFGFGCDTPDNGDTRVDLFADDFIEPWIQENDPVCKEDGLCGPIGCLDDPDCLPCGADGTCATDCALPDVDCATQHVGELCRADTQCMSGLCVFWQEEAGTRFCSQACENDSTCPDGMSCQDVMPFGRVCYYDDEPPGTLGAKCELATDCASYICEEGRCVVECDLARNMGCPEDFECTTLDEENYYCHAIAEPGGCATGGQTGSGPGPAMLLVLAALAARRRRWAPAGRRCD